METGDVEGRGRGKKANVLEGNALRLDDVDGLDVATNVPVDALLGLLLLDELRKVVHALLLRRNTRTTGVLERIALDGVRDGRTGELGRVGRVGAVGSEVDLENLLVVGVDDGVEVERVGVEVLVLAEASVEESLLETETLAEAVLVADRPSVAENLVGGDACSGKEEVRQIWEEKEKREGTHRLQRTT
jgi:ribosomal protein L12E/L44/L45/RPP1/RPP2